MLHGVVAPLVVVAVLVLPLVALHLSRSEPPLPGSPAALGVAVASCRPGGGGADDVAVAGRWDRGDGVLWAMQITDIHLSKFEEERLERFQRFVQDVVPVVDPAFIVATGDLTDASKRPWTWEARGQNPEEWEAYRTTLEGAGIGREGGIPLLDIGGNHDYFNVPNKGSSDNWFKRTAMSHKYEKEMGLRRPSTGSPHYSFEYDTPFAKHRVVAVDAAVSPAAARHFFGVLSREGLEFLESEPLSGDSEDERPHATISMAHYPMTAIVDTGVTTSAGSSVPEVLRDGNVVAHLSGHLHGLLGKIHPWLGESLYGHHDGGTLELELGDFVSRHKYRMLAFDHGVFSFSEARLGEWPTITVLNPVDSRFVTPKSTPYATCDSSHVRALICSPNELTDVTGKLELSAGHSGPDLVFSPAPGVPWRQNAPGSDAGCGVWTAPWDPSKVPAGEHTITVSASDSGSNCRSTSIPFAVDGTVSRPPSSFGRELSIGNMRRWTLVGVALVEATLIAVLFGSCLFVRYLRSLSSEGDAAVDEWIHKTIAKQRLAHNSGCFDRVLEALGVHQLLPVDAAGSGSLKSWITGLVGRAMLPYIHLAYRRPRVLAFLLGYAVYLPLGPWFAGRVYDNDWAVVFAWGIYSKGMLIDHFDSVINMAMLLVFSFTPLVQYLALSSLGSEFPKCADRASSPTTAILIYPIVVYARKGMRMLNTFYGIESLLLAPARTWYHWIAFLTCMYTLLTDLWMRFGFAAHKQPSSDLKHPRRQ